LSIIIDSIDFAVSATTASSGSSLSGCTIINYVHIYNVEVSSGFVNPAGVSNIVITRNKIRVLYFGYYGGSSNIDNVIIQNNVLNDIVGNAVYGNDTITNLFIKNNIIITCSSLGLASQ
jgi:hypothetical protein